MILEHEGEVDKMYTFIWYSKPTCKTGRNLRIELGIRGGFQLPRNFDRYCEILIGWGCKTPGRITFPNGNLKALNHPNAILEARNKFHALQKMQSNGVRVPQFGAIPDGIEYPLIARTAFHQGGQGFWFCENRNEAEGASREGANYFQKFIEIKKEYRLHVFDNEILYAVKKIPKEGEEVDQIVRSNKKGWRFSRVISYSDKLSDQAIKAVKSLGLDFGAVDCCIGMDGYIYIIEVNSAPGLEQTSFQTWLECFRHKIRG